MTDGGRMRHDPPGASYGEVFADAEFRALWLAQAASLVGDQFARVALTVLVFDRTGSAGLAAGTYALTFVPDLVGGPLLAGLADRYPRRQVMVVSDVVRAVLVAVMAVHGLPLWLLAGLLVAVQLAGAPFFPARAAAMKQLLTGDRYVVGSSVSNQTAQAAQVFGFAGGGALVAGVGATNALLIDAGTFAASAALIRFGIRDRPLTQGPTRPGWWEAMAAGSALVWRNRRLRALIALACVSGCYVTVEGVAVPYAAEIGGGAGTAGLLMAANPLGQMVGMLLLTRQEPARRLRMTGWLAVGSCLPLIGCWAHPGLAVTLGLWALSGLCASYQLTANATFVQLVPDQQTGQAIGLARTALLVAQGAGVLVAGTAADWWSPSVVVAGAGVLGVLTAAGGAWSYARAFGLRGKRAMG